MEHLRRGAAGFQELLLGYGLLVHDTDGGVHSNVRVHDGGLVHGNADVPVKEPDYRGHGVVNDHAAGVQHAPDYVYSVLRGGEPFGYLDAAPAVHDDFNVVVGVDVHLLHVGGVDPFLQKGISRHVLIEFGAEFFRGESLQGDPALDQVLHHQLFQDGGGALGVPVPGACYGGGMVLGEVALYVFQYLVVGKAAVLCRCKEDVV